MLERKGKMQNSRLEEYKQEEYKQEAYNVYCCCYNFQYEEREKVAITDNKLEKAGGDWTLLHEDL